ncbi:MAG: HD domain-containing protein [Candidatus Shapirobacteria bacterium]|nr:HD domain-containing protein [Candidatus Shapirobacteria bacterium]
MAKITKLDLKRYELMYNNFDGGHDKRHCLLVRKMAVKLAKKYLPNKIELVYIAATLHDIGISIDRENHESNGEKIIRQDKYLKDNLSLKDFEELCHAVKEHRASTGNPQTILAKIISDADRGGGSPNTSEAFTRAYNYGLKNFPKLTKNEQILRSAKHQVNKFSQGSYGRRTYFPETEKRLKKVYDPIINAWKKGDLKYLKSLIKTLVK